jgi:hypothetical protein
MRSFIIRLKRKFRKRRKVRIVRGLRSHYI